MGMSKSSGTEGLHQQGNKILVCTERQTRRWEGRKSEYAVGHPFVVCYSRSMTKLLLFLLLLFTDARIVTKNAINLPISRGKDLAAVISDFQFLGLRHKMQGSHDARRTLRRKQGGMVISMLIFP